MLSRAWARGDGEAVRDRGSRQEPSRRLRDAPVAGGWSAREEDRRLHAVLRSTAGFRCVVRPAVGGEPRQATTRRHVGWIHAAGGARCHRPARAGSAFHGGSRRQDGTFVAVDERATDVTSRRVCRRKELGNSAALMESCSTSSSARRQGLAKRGRPTDDSPSASWRTGQLMRCWDRYSYAGKRTGRCFNRPGGARKQLRTRCAAGPSRSLKRGNRCQRVFPVVGLRRLARTIGRSAESPQQGVISGFPVMSLIAFLHDICF